MKNIELDLNKHNNLINIIEDVEITAFIKLNKNQYIKYNLNVIHKIPYLKSKITIKVVLLDSARFDFEGILRIEKGAYQTDTYLKVDCLIIGENAYARAVPSLEILESDVKAGHGATIGYINPEELYYLKSHGLNKNQAEQLIINAFLRH